tara:strand:+ start:147 stop:299 length:153 start_codon:yes stop_codon:yes gene_type:complete
MPDIKIIKGISLMIMLGINKEVKIKGLKTSTFKFLKNSISSNKLKIIPKQ